MTATIRTLVFLLTLVTLAGCAAQRVPTPAPDPLTANAQTSFDYLLYLDQRSMLMALTMNDPQPDTEEFDQAIAVQQIASKALDRVIAVHPSAMLYGEMAALYFNPRQASKALAILNKGLDLYPEDRMLLGLMVNAHLLKQDQEMATLTLEQFILTQPDDIQARIRLVTILVESKEFARALDQIKLIPKAEHSPRVLYLKARSQSRIGNRALALKTLQNILKKVPDHYEALAELAYIQELNAEFAQAVNTYAKLLNLGGPEPEIRSRIIALNLKLNRVDQALKSALEGPDTKFFMLQAAGIFLSQDFPAQASAVLDRLNGLSPVPPEYYFYKAVIAFDAEEDPEKALSFLDQISTEEKNYAQSLLFRIQILMNMSRKDEAMNILTTARETFPNDLRFDRIHAEYLTLDKKYEQAALVLKQAMEKHGDNQELLFQYGALLDMQGMRDRAIEIMERILENDPRNADALNYVGYTLADEGRDLKRALVLIENALKQKPDNGAITDSLAWVYFKLDRMEDAWTQIRRALKLMGDDPIVWEHYGDIANAMGKKAAALTGYKNALKLEPEDPDAIQDKINKL